MRSTAAFDMALVHHGFRTALHDVPDLIRTTPAGNIRQAAMVGAHLDFVVLVLHHHHAAEDELIWPKLHERVPAHDGEIARMEGAHRAIAAAVDAAKAAAHPWAKTGEGTERLMGAVAVLIDVVDEHLDDEEREVVPLIDRYITASEWKKAIARGASILRLHPKLGLVFAGFVLEGATAADRRRFLDGVPAPARLMWNAVGARVYEGYRLRL